MHLTVNERNSTALVYGGSQIVVFNMYKIIS
jgi:hypothetical protein